MRWSRFVAVAALVAALAACTREPPPYESRYTTPPPSAPPSPPLPPGASFVDDFQRPDTAWGLGEGWDMRGAQEGRPVLPVATGAFIRNGHYVSSDDSGVYAVRTVRNTIRRVGVEGRWTRVGEGGDESLVMGISANEDLSKFVKLTVTRDGWAVTQRRESAEAQVAVKGSFKPPLDVNRTYRFELDAADGTVTVRVPGAEQKAKLGTIGLLGNRAYWQHYSEPAEIPIGVKFCIDMSWVAEQGQPLDALPAT